MALYPDVRADGCIFSDIAICIQCILSPLLQGVITAATICFFKANAPESYIGIAILEAFIVIFFILIYLLSLQYLLTYIHWPLLVSHYFQNSNIPIFTFALRELWLS